MAADEADPRPEPWRRAWTERGYAPIAFDGPAVERAKARLLARTAVLGFTATDDADPRLEVDGREQRPVSHDGGVLQFMFAARAAGARLLSRSGTPRDHDPASLDARRLGLAVSGIWIEDGLLARVAVDLSDPRLGPGFYPPETQDGVTWRWTDSQAVLPGALWAGLEGLIVLHVAVVGMQRSWVD